MRLFPVTDAFAFVVMVMVMSAAASPQSAAKEKAKHSAQRAYLGFDSNDYPGDAALVALKQTFSFAGYWLNNPPGASLNSWTGKRAALRGRGFGFLVLFNGRLQRELKTPARGTALGVSDSQVAAESAKREGFSSGTVIFLDQEEGGSMEPEQMAYIEAWVKGVAASGFRPGIYCSGMPAGAGKGVFVVTADDIRERLKPRTIAFFVYNDACPPSPGCAYPKEPPLPSESGVAFAAVWQFAQSPRRRKYTRACSATYNHDGNCYPLGLGPGYPFLDVESATSPDPSNGR